MELIKSDQTYAQIEVLSAAIVNAINNTLQKKEQVVVAVSGGKSPIDLFKKLSQLELPWDKVIITLVDERVIDTANPDSNEHLVKTYLLKNKARDAKFIGLMNNSKPNHFENLAIDIAILGMGTDGHTASIFPDCPEFKSIIAIPNQNQYMLTNPKFAPYQRISLTLNALINIPHLFLAINGTEKLDILIKADENINDNYPISYVLSSRPDIRAYWHN